MGYNSISVRANGALKINSIKPNNSKHHDKKPEEEEKLRTENRKTQIGEWCSMKRFQMH